MTLYNLRKCLMWFHYGNCQKDIEKLKKENTDLKSQIPQLLAQIQEQKGIVDYILHDKEVEIKNLKQQLVEKEQQLEVEKANKSIRESWQPALKKSSRKTKE